MFHLALDSTRRTRSSSSTIHSPTRLHRTWVHALGCAALLGGSGWAQVTERVSVATGGTQADNGSTTAGISPDGRFVVFYSDATNLVPGDTNARRDAFLHDRRTGTTERVSVGAGGVQGNNHSAGSLNGYPSITPDGRYVVFDSDATNLVAGDTNVATDIFVRDRVSGTTERVNVGAGGLQANGPSRVGLSAISSDGRYVVFSSLATDLVAGDTNGIEDVFVRDRVAGTTERASVSTSGAQTNQLSYGGSITPDGRYVAFASNATTLVAGDTNGSQDVFLRDRTAGTTERVSLDSAGMQGNSFSSGPSMSDDGRYVAFISQATNLVPGDTNGSFDLFVRDRVTGTTERADVDSNGNQANPVLGFHFGFVSGDGRYVVFSSDATNLVPGDTNGALDVFLRDRIAGTTERVSLDSAGNQASANGNTPSISGDGRYVLFGSDSASLVPGDTNGWPDLFVRDRLCVDRTTEIASVDSNETPGNHLSYWSSLSADGRYVAFRSGASNLAPGDSGPYYDIFVRDRQAGTTERVSVDSNELEANGDSTSSFLSDDGRYVAFHSVASNLVVGDTNGFSDIFVRDRQTGTTERVSVATNGAQGNNACNEFPSTSADGRFVVFRSTASNLVAGDTNGFSDIFVRDRSSGTTERVSVATGGAQGDDESGSSSISADGRFVVFTSDATNLVAGDTNGYGDVFVRDRQSGTTERVSVATGGAQGNFESGSYPWYSISADGRFVAFTSRASNLVPGDTNGTFDVFVRDRLAGTTERVSVDSIGNEAVGTQGSGSGSLSADGRYVAFRSFMTNLVPVDTNGAWDIFVRDRQRGTTERVSVDSDGAQGNDDSWDPSMSADGRSVAFDSDATNLVPGDLNGFEDVFVHEGAYTPGFTSLCDPGVDGVIGCPCSNPPSGPGRGCNNSSGTGGARLAASGFPCLSMDSLVLTTSGEKPTALSIVWQGPTSAAAGVVFGQGIRCANGNLKRLYFKTAAGGSITAPEFGIGDPSISVRSAALGSTILPGQSRYYFVSYRDPTVLGGCPASSSVNASQTGRVDWSG